MNQEAELLNIIKELEMKLGRPVPLEEIRVSAEDMGIKDTEAVVGKLKKIMLIEEPRKHRIQTKMTYMNGEPMTWNDIDWIIHNSLDK